ncbi:hypothetical protein TNIN_72861, partial [Trichonephila inaurata madagascariensis]
YASTKRDTLSKCTIRRIRIINCKLPTEKELEKIPQGSFEKFLADVDGIDVPSLLCKDNDIAKINIWRNERPLNSFDRKKVFYFLLT